MKNDSKISWIGGFKGMISILLFAYFFLRVFYPSVYYGDIELSHTNSEFDVSIAQSVFGGLINGNFLQCIFCMLIGLTISYQIFSAEKKEYLSDVMIKRYIRLSLPVFFVTLFIYFIWKKDLFSDTSLSSITYSSYGFYENIPKFSEIFKTSFITDWFKGDPTFSIAFSLLEYIFLGSFLSYILGILSWNKNTKIIIVYIIVLLIYFVLDSFYLCFVIGTLLAYIIHKYEQKDEMTIIGVILLLIGLFLGGYPTEIEPTNVYNAFSFLPKWVTIYQFYHIIGAGLTILGIYYISGVCKVLSFGIFRLFGNISYGMYLISMPLILSLSNYIFLKIYKGADGYFSAVFVTFILSLIAIIILSIIFYYVIEFISNIVASKTVKLLS